MPSEQWKKRNIERLRKYRRDWYHKNREREAALSRERQRIRTGKLKRWFRAYKKTLKCARCPENFWACLEFHHKASYKKEIAVSQAIAQGWCKERIVREIAKCEVLCANCHRKHHHK